MYKYHFLGNTHQLAFDLTTAHYFWRAISISPQDLVKSLQFCNGNFRADNSVLAWIVFQFLKIIFKIIIRMTSKSCPTCNGGVPCLPSSLMGQGSRITIDLNAVSSLKQPEFVHPKLGLKPQTFRIPGTIRGSKWWCLSIFGHEPKLCLLFYIFSILSNPIVKKISVKSGGNGRFRHETPKVIAHFFHRRWKRC